ncbi:hypothetical protein [Pedobacter panaciterrae]
MKKILIFVLIASSFSCSVSRINISASEYSTGHMGMSGENVFVFKNTNQFYYYERLGYSEGTFDWVSNNSIRLTSKVMGFNIPDKETRYYKDLNNKVIVFKGNKLFFEGFVLKRIKVK